MTYTHSEACIGLVKVLLLSSALVCAMRPEKIIAADANHPSQEKPSTSKADVPATRIEPPSVEKTRVLVVTGGHSFDEKAFFQMFEDMPDLTWHHVRFKATAENMLNLDASRDYDVILFYDMHQNHKTHSERWLDLLARGKGAVFMHHAAGSYRKWDEYRRIIGGKADFGKYVVDGVERQGYKYDVAFKVRVADRSHPITEGVEDFDIVDEAYSQVSTNPDVRVLLTVDHPDNAKDVGWINTYRNSPVVYLQLGHGPSAYQHQSVRTLLGRALRWAAGKLPEKSAVDAEGFVSLFNEKNLVGWQIEGDAGAWSVEDGVIRGAGGGGGGGWLRSPRVYKDFLLRLEYKISAGGESGVLFRAGAGGDPAVTGHEVRISNEASSRDKLRRTGSLDGTIAARRRPDESPDTWHRMEIIAEEGRVTVKIDDQKITEADLGQVKKLAARPLAGYIGLLNRGSAVEFRRVRIKELAGGKRVEP